MRLPWSRTAAQTDPYWDAFINRPPADPNNLITHAFKQVKRGGVNPVKTEIHSPNVMSAHIKELAKFYGADLVGIAAVSSEGRSAIVCVMRSEYDSRTAAGIGGQTAALKGLFATFSLGAYVRELGYAADTSEDNREQLAVAAGLGKLDSNGRLVTHRFGDRVYLAEVLLTDLPLEPDARA